MSYSQLSELKRILTPEEIERVKVYLKNIGMNSKILVSKFSLNTGIDINTSAKALKLLVDQDVLEYQFAIRCPECGLLLKTVDSPSSSVEELYCYNCDENVSISTDDIEVIYSLKTPPFVEGQQSNVETSSVKSAVPYNDSLTMLLQSGVLDFNRVFYEPTEEQYLLLENKYNKIFGSHKNTKEKGDTLEALVIYLFSLCKHFRVSDIRVKPNQIDCYVRNKLYIPGISSTEIADSFEIECKNEARTPSSTYMNKLHSILRISGKRFGIIVSKSSAPRTFNQLSHQIFLSDKMIIVSLDNNDLKNIIVDKCNLLECLERKIDSVKLDSTMDLRDLGLYNA